jgi:hypothetical protein
VRLVVSSPSDAGITGHVRGLVREQVYKEIEFLYYLLDHLCGLVDRDPEVPSSIPYATRFSEKS